MNKTTAHKPILSTTILALLCAAATASAAPPPPITIDTVTIGDPGNANDTVTATDGSGLHFGGVSYTYDIGRYEVTLTQYTTFLNAVAATDPNGLYHPLMELDLEIAGIARSGDSGSYTYAVLGDGQRPVTYVSFFDAMRFANWVNNGQGSGSTETGAYTLSLGGLAPRNAGASVFVASENEWYKAAFYDPVSAGADALGSADYWQYATRSDTAPGNVVGPGANQANYYNGVFSVTQSGSRSGTENYLTPGGAYSGSASYYGTYDQAGNVSEWNDTVIGSSRGRRGSAFDLAANDLPSSRRDDFMGPTEFSSDMGFRIAIVVPEPSSALLLLGSGMMCSLRRRRGSAL